MPSQCTSPLPSRSAIAVAALLLTITAVPLASAQSSAWMTDHELRRAFSGTTIEGHYADGRSFVESYLKSGALDYRETGRKRHQTGHWSIVAGAFCTIYNTSPTGGCFRVRRHSDNCFEFYFQARTEAQARAPDRGRPSWTARAWRQGQPATCHEKPVV
ncbi:MAG: hypothetical protein KDJ36_05115 [Hyphomicrobiaceae bacterium]|nr:hypothetical protein [Hyphomicrobiaceae bacterium]